jgi:hypothetical protein
VTARAVVFVEGQPHAAGQGCVCDPWCAVHAAWLQPGTCVRSAAQDQQARC